MTSTGHASSRALKSEGPENVARRQPGMAEFIVLMSLVTSVTAVSIDTLLPALGAIGRDLGVVDANDTQFVITLFIFGMVFGEMVFGPISDAVGRKRAIIAGLVIYCAGAVVAMTAQSMALILIGRIIQGIGAAGPKIASRALIRDRYEGDAMGRILSFIFMVFIFIPMLAPALGQLVIAIADWRAIFVVYLGLSAIVALWLGLRQPETLPTQRRIPFSFWAILRNARLILGRRRIVAYTVAVGFIFGAFLLYLSTAQALFLDLYDISDRFPLYFAGLAAAVALASFANSQLVMRFGMARIATGALVGLIVFAIGLLAVTVAHGGVPPFAAFLGLMFAMFFCAGMLFGNLNALAMQSLGNVAGIGASLVASVSSLMAVLVSVAVGRFYDGTAIPLSAGFLVAGIGGLALVLAAGTGRTDAI